VTSVTAGEEPTWTDHTLRRLHLARAELLILLATERGRMIEKADRNVAEAERLAELRHGEDPVRAKEGVGV
jgi:hypothetical protein